MIFDNDAITELRMLIRDKMSERRYVHTLGVEKMAKYLGDIIIPKHTNELCVAALLHDITKELTYEEQVHLLEESEISCTKEDLDTKPALHSISAVPFIKKYFRKYATADVLSAVFNHTLGDVNMSVFDEIIFISDYAEENRKYISCKEVREYLLININKSNSQEKNITILHKASLLAINSTIDSLTRKGESINSRTVLTKQYLESVIDN